MCRKEDGPVEGDGPLGDGPNYSADHPGRVAPKTRDMSSKSGLKNSPGPH